MSQVYLWFKDDLRISNNQALSSLLNDSTSNKRALFIFDETEYLLCEAQRWWLAKALESLSQKLFLLNINLDIVFEKPAIFFEKEIRKKKIKKIIWNRSCSFEDNKLEEKIKIILYKNNIDFKEFAPNLLNLPDEIKKEDGTPFKVFTHYWKKSEEKYLKKINTIKFLDISLPYSKNKNNLDNKSIKKIYPAKKWYCKFEKYWQPTEEKGAELLNNFVTQKISNYSNNRDVPSVEGTSKLSPYLRFGQISVNQIMKKCLEIKNKNIGFRKYLNEIGWREFCHSLIYNFPGMIKNNLRNNFNKFEWSKDLKFLEKWKKGTTGYPIVDAGMRELYETGWMHNRVRMITASFLVKHLRINWLEGEKYFKDTLLDYNIANNVSGWQWVAGTGADAAPYFRIFNPILQGEKFDPKGTYVKKWCKELSNVPDEFIHQPWNMSEELQKEVKVIIGKDYPKPIVNHEEARKKALDAFFKLKK
jgi:deoxyribodipyrimidine photo-lyase